MRLSAAERTLVGAQFLGFETDNDLLPILAPPSAGFFIRAARRLAVNELPLSASHSFIFMVSSTRLNLYIPRTKRYYTYNYTVYEQEKGGARFILKVMSGDIR